MGANNARRLQSVLCPVSKALSTVSARIQATVIRTDLGILAGMRMDVRKRDIVWRIESASEESASGITEEQVVIGRSR